ncbi:ATPase [Trypanosoma melophagium]|uniref:ATPase n=1 Tax=Trypanosoma melophagium TaxID=715481 RepID=UPI00351A9826|nr:ATPase [Trypanosoma melophagium]
MTASLSSRKIDEALRLSAEARELLLLHGHSRKATVVSIRRIQEILRAILQCTSLIQTYDQTPYRSSIYNHVSRTFLSVLDLQPEGDETGNSCNHNNDTSYNRDSLEKMSNHPMHAMMNDDIGISEEVSALGPESSADNTKSNNNNNIVRWTDIVGCEEAITALKQATTLPLQFPHLFKAPRRPPRRILLYGPPGTGKTLLAAATATEYDAPLLTISSADILSKWIGESERHVRRLFEAAAQLPRSVLFFDEVDAICGERGGSNESEASRRIKTELLLQIQSVDSGRVTIIAATNLPWELDSAFRRRFDHLVFIDLPTPSARRQLFLSELQLISHSLNESDFDWLVQNTEGYSASDIRHIVQHAIMEPIHRIAQATYVRCVPVSLSSFNSAVERLKSRTQYVPCAEEDEGAMPLCGVPAAELHAPDVGRDDFERAISEFPPSVSTEEMKKFSQWRKREKHTSG